MKVEVPTSTRIEIFATTINKTLEGVGIALS